MSHTLVAARTNLDLNTLILMVLEAIYRGAGFDRALFAFVNQERTYIEGRLGLGEDVDRLVERFRFRMAGTRGPGLRRFARQAKRVGYREATSPGSWAAVLWGSIRSSSAAR